MVLQNFDLFSSEFMFHLERNKERRKKTFIGGVISITIIAITIVYFSYLMYIYSTNKIDPKYKMQSFISDEKIDFTPDSEFYGFNLILSSTQTLSMLEKQTGKSYINFIPAFQVSAVGQQTQYIMLDVIDCKSEKLKGYQCIDFSKSQDYRLQINDITNYIADLILVVYKCTDTDFFKQSTLQNCASEAEINNVINNREGFFQLKMKTSQFNTTSESMEVRYKKYNINFQGNLMVYSKQKSVKLITDVKKGVLIQSTESKVSIIDYIKEERTFDRQTLIDQSNISAIAQISISLDEQIQYIQIQYATFLEVLSIFNSTFAVLMGLGLFARYFSRQLIYDQFKLTLIQELFSQSYLQMLLQKQSYSKYKADNQKDKITPYQNMVKQLKENLNQNNNIEINKNNSQISPQESDCEITQVDETGTLDQHQLHQLQQNKLNVSLINSLIKSKLPLNSDLQNQQCDNNLKELKSPTSVIHSDRFSLQNQSENKFIINQDSQKKEKQVDTFQEKRLSKFQQKSECKMDDSKQQYLKQSQNNKPSQSNDIMKSDYQASNNLDIENQNQKQNKQNFSIDVLEQFMNCIKNGDNLQSIFNSKTYRKRIDQQIDQQLNIFNLVKEVIFIKKAIMILLSVEQYAAIKLIGSTLDDQSELVSVNHINEQLKQENSQELLTQNIGRFFEKVKNSKRNSIDNRIISSLIN